jgi:hypothetical protein
MESYVESEIAINLAIANEIRAEKKELKDKIE